MTLLARLPAGERLDLTTFSDDEWNELRREKPPLICLGCGGPMHTRRHPLQSDADEVELRTFAHNPGAGERCRALGYDESPGHDRLKRRLAEGARRAGWSTQFEVQSSPECRADVVATEPKSGKQHALEAQLAPLDLHQATQRTDRYVKDFGDCTWTHVGRREWSGRVPSLRVATEDKSMVVSGILIDLADERSAPPTPVVEVIPQILKNEIRYVFDQSQEWGSFIAAAAMSRGGAIPRRRRQPRSVGGATRFCERFKTVPVAARILLAAGYCSVSEFETSLYYAHLTFREWGHDYWTDRHRAALALAGEHPQLNYLDSEVIAAMQRFNVGRN